MSLPNLDSSSAMDIPAQQSVLNVNSMPSTPITGAIQTNSVQNSNVGSAQIGATSTMPSNSGPPPTVKLTPISNILNNAPTASGLGVKSQGSASASTVSNVSNISDLPAQQILSKARLQDLVREIDPTAQLDDEVEEMLMQIADDFVETCVSSACLFAKHRKANTIDVKDVQLHLERNWNMWIPGFGTDELRPYKRAPVTEAHKQRLALIRKALKKY